MICRWCGAVLRETDAVCGRCGRQVPPLSDCGGFYDLVPGARGGAGVRMPAPAPQAQRQPVRSAPVQASKKQGQGTIPLLVLCLLLMTLASVLFLRGCSLAAERDAAVAAKDQAERELQELKEELREDASEPATKPANADQDREDPQTGNTLTVEESPVTGESEAVETVHISVAEDGSFLLAETDGSWMEDESDVYYVLKNAEYNCSVGLLLSRSEAGMPVLELREREEDTARYTWLWQYSPVGEEYWQDLTNEASAETGECPRLPEGCTGGDTQLRCVIRWTMDDRTIELIISGIRYGKE